MMKRLFLIGLLAMFICLTAVQGGWAGEPGDPSYLLVEQWQTDRRLEVPESVLYDASAEILYVSNISGKPAEKNGRGFISIVSLEGKIINLKWAAGLNAPKGMVISGGRLFVTDIDHLVEISMPDGRVRTRYPAPGAKFLNDLAADAAGNIYATDSSSKNSVIYKLSDNKITPWVTGGEIKKPNGLLMEKGRLLVGNSGDGCIKAVHLKTRQVETIATVGCGIDGLQPDGKGNFFVSDWKGKTSFVTASGKVDVLMDTTDSKINAADFGYVVGKGLLLIPTFFDNRVVAYKIK